ncbi:MAG: nitroreductase/quinone reductase family protein [Actinomycetota bacterium]
MSERESNPLIDRILTPLVSSRPGSWFYVNVAPHLDRVLLRLTGGRFTTGGRHRVGFLKVKGAKSGLERTTPLVYTRDGEKILLVASRGGDVKHPAWYRNVVANPEVRFSIDAQERAYSARELDGADRERAWPLVVRRYPGYAIYEQRAGERKIPVIELAPRGA